MYKSTFILILMFLTCISCKKQEKTPIPQAETEKGTYFSIIQFTQDQWDTYHGQPYTLTCVKTLNGKSDTSMVSAYKADWGAIFKIFFESDIGDPKYLGKYRFSTFDENLLGTRCYYYEAMNDSLYTRKLQISTDPTNNKIKAIYIETEKYNGLTQRSQKLLYEPVKLIQIQEYEKSDTGPAKNSITQYRF
ncbi:MAG: hypothetical protein WCG87_10680 [Bacteroidota bacterium]